MALLQANAVISTTALDRATNCTAAKLTGVPAFIDTPAPPEISAYSGLGIVRYVVLLDPGCDIVPGDSLSIQSWGPHTVSPGKAYRVFAADPAGGLGLETIDCIVGEPIQR